jgi:tetratricopeptide (TPR) repeat protein
MNVRNFLTLGVGICLMAGCASPGRESFDIARELDKNRRFDDALPMYEDAVVKDPSNQEYAAALKSARSRLARQPLESAREKLKALPLTYAALLDARRDIDRALKVDPGNGDAVALAESVKGLLDAMAKRAESGYAAAMKALESREYPLALEKFREIALYYPTYLDLSTRITATENSAISYYLKEADRHKAADDVESLIKSLEAALSIKPANQQIAGVLREVKAVNTAGVNIARAEKLAAENRWDQAQLHLKRALKLNPTAAEAESISRLYTEGGTKLMEKASTHLEKGDIYSAYADIMGAAAFNPTVLKAPEFENLRSGLVSRMTARAGDLETAGQIGQALYWSECALRVAGPQDALNQKIQALTDKVKQRVTKKIAIMDFAPPASNPDAARLVTDSLLSYMTRNASGDVKILARDILGTLIKEIELGQAGVAIEAAKKSGKLKGTDVFIFGSLLQYAVEKNVEEGQKTVLAKVGVDREPNPQYMVWLAENPKASPEERRNAPPQLIDRDRTETIRYKVATHRKTANVTISFRVVDVESSEVIITKTLNYRKEATGSYSEGVEVAGIPYQKLEIPADSDLLGKTVDEAITELGRQVLSRFQNLQEAYLNSAEAFRKRGDSDSMAERYMDAVVTEELKNMKSQITDTARREMDLLLKRAEKYPI